MAVVQRRATLLSVLLVAASPAMAVPADFPRFDVEQACATLVGTTDPKAPMRNLCIDREQRAYMLGGVLWQSSSPADRVKCRDLAERSRTYKYVYLAACLRSAGRQKALTTPRTFRY